MSRGSRTLIFLLALVGLPAASPAQTAALRQGGEFQVNTYTTGYQGNPAVGFDGGGNFVVVWRSLGSTGTDTSSFSIQARRYDSAGTPLAAEFQVNAYTTNDQAAPDVAVDGAGSFVVVWRGESSTEYSYGIHAQRFDAAGAPLGAELQVNTYTPSMQNFPEVALDGAGNFVVVWHSYGSAGDDTAAFSIQARRYDSAGSPLAAEFQVNTYTTDTQGFPEVAFDGAGNFVVVWESVGSTGSDTSGSSIQARRYDSAGTPLAAEFQVNTYTTNDQSLPEVAFDGAGNSVVVWESIGSAGGDTSLKSVQARRYDSAGTPLGAEFQLNTYTTSDQGVPAVAFDGAGNFVVTWYSNGSTGADTDDKSAQARRYDSAGTPLGAEFQLNTYTTNAQSLAEIVFDGSGNFVVVWDSNGGPGDDGRSIQAQRFVTARPILGKKLLVKDPSGDEPQRAVVALGKETATDIGPAVLGDPVANGGTLRVIANGGTDSDQTYVLDPSGWSVLGSTGFKYSGPTGGDGDAVKKVLIKRTAGGTALVKAIVKGNVGTQSLDVVPPNPGTDGGIILTINGGAAYCAALGGAAGGTTVKDDIKGWKLINASAEGCPAP